MNEKITAALKNIYLILDVSAVYAAIFKRYNKHKWRKDETSRHWRTQGGGIGLLPIAWKDIAQWFIELCRDWAVIAQF